MGEFHSMYWALSRESMRDIQNFVKGNLESEISELWFSKDPPRLRIDKYTESNSIKCNQFKGKEWEKITHEGGGYQPVVFEKPVCVYKIVSVETRISDPNVFSKWAD